MDPPRDLRELAELLARNLNATQGTVRVTLTFRDGRYIDGWRNTRLAPKVLEQVPVVAGDEVSRSGQ